MVWGLGRWLDRTRHFKTSTNVFQYLLIWPSILKTILSCSHLLLLHKTKKRNKEMYFCLKNSLYDWLITAGKNGRYQFLYLKSMQSKSRVLIQTKPVSSVAACLHWQSCRQASEVSILNRKLNSSYLGLQLKISRLANTGSQSNLKYDTATLSVDPLTVHTFPLSRSYWYRPDWGRTKYWDCVTFICRCPCCYILLIRVCSEVTCFNHYSLNNTTSHIFMGDMCFKKKTFMKSVCSLW